MMLDNVSVQTIISAVGGFLSLLLSLGGWVIIQYIKGNRDAMQTIKLDLGAAIAAIKADNLSLKADMLKEQKEMEIRFNDMIKTIESRTNNHAERLSEISQLVLADKLEIYKVFMPAVKIEEAVNKIEASMKENQKYLRDDIKALNDKIEGRRKND